MVTEMRLPKVIERCAISEAVTEIRFETNLPGEAVFGVVYNALKERYGALEKLPILQIPEVMRASDPNLQYLPGYKLSMDNFRVQIGPKVLSCSVVSPYPGWARYFAEIGEVFGCIRELGFISTVTRFAIRYIDFFQFDIFRKIDVGVFLGNDRLEGVPMGLRVDIQKGRFRCLLQISNEATWQANSENIKGSAFDVDTYLASGEGDLFEQMNELLEEAHLIQKNLFFGLLKPDFLESLKPSY
jgi:uncharacterized protein (TIGR04255 family)